MLKRAEKEHLPIIRDLCKNSIIGTKILCLVTAYGFDRDFLEIWIMLKNDEITAVLTKFYDDITLLATADADNEQLESFFNMVSFTSLACAEKCCVALGLKPDSVKNGYVYKGELTDFSCDSLEEDNYRSAYKLISKEIPGSFSSDKEAYLSFLSDFTFRKRRLLARGVCTLTDSQLSSVALTSSETEASAVISGVACDSKLQKKGLGKKTVLSLVNELKKEGKEVYVVALNEKAEGFYEHIGFVEKEKIAFVERKNHV